MLNIAKTAALVLAAMAPVLGVAQRSEGRPDRKPSPATSTAAASVAQPGSQSAPGSQQLVTSENFFLANSKSNAATSNQPATAPSPLVRTAPALQAPPITPQVVATSLTTPAAQPGMNATPSPEATAAVRYADGQLTVVSQNAPLGAVLKLISAKTGAVIDLAPELQNEPVIAQIGPSEVREVMTALLDSPKIDYIIMGSAPGGLGRILVRRRQSFGSIASAASQPAQPRPQDAETEIKLNENGPQVGVAKPQAMTQEQLMENWKKVREEKRLAEIEQQRQERENEATHVEPSPQPVPQPNNADNPPQN